MRTREPDSESRFVAVLRAGSLYFALVFAVGFMLGLVRVLWLVPALGERTAELLEAPVMLAATVASARFVVRRLGVPPKAGIRLAVGGLALTWLLLLDVLVVLELRGISLAESLATRDPVAGAVYVILLLLFAAMPWLLSSRSNGATEGASEGASEQGRASSIGGPDSSS